MNTLFISFSIGILLLLVLIVITVKGLREPADPPYPTQDDIDAAMVSVDKAEIERVAFMVGAHMGEYAASPLWERANDMRITLAILSNPDGEY